MTAPHLPASVVGLLTAKIGSIGRAALKTAQARTSALYRDGGHSRDAIPDATSALAYALVRMPATYAACIRAFDLAAVQVPDFVPTRLLDLGAGTGSATLAATAVWPDLITAHIVEPNPALASIATDVLAHATSLQPTYDVSDLTKPRTQLPAADLVTLSYVLAEQPLGAVGALVARIAAASRGLIVIVEPGTPQGHARVLAARDALIAAGLDILAPCPHARACPLPTGDWCHFSIRLQRSAAHLYVKDADVPFEDERFSFVAAARPGLGTPAGARLIRQTNIEKGFADLPLCTATGLETRRVRKRDAADYKRAKSLDWGDAV